MLSCTSHRMEDHRSLYKKKTPPWKESLRERCCQRLKASRELFFNHCRLLSFPEEESEKALSGLVGQVLTQELDQLKESQAGVPSLSLVESFSEEEIFSAIEEVQQEIFSEEQKLLKENCANKLLEDRLVLSQVESFQVPQVVCPLCQRFSLKEDGKAISCACGLRVFAEKETLRLDQMKQSLESGLQAHFSLGACTSNVNFGLAHGAGATNLLMTCQGCDFIFVVI